MTFEGFEGSIDKKKRNITLTLTYDGEEPDDVQKERDFKVMLGFISLALANVTHADEDAPSPKKKNGGLKND